MGIMDPMAHNIRDAVEEKRPVEIVSMEYDAIEYKTYIHPQTVRRIRTECDMIVTDGTPQPPTLEGYTGQTNRYQVKGVSVCTDVPNYDQEEQEGLAYKDALNELSQYDLRLVEDLTTA